MGTGEIPREEENPMACQTNKKLKRTESCDDLPKPDSEIIKESSSSNQNVEFKFISPSRDESTSEKNAIAENGNTIEICYDENTGECPAIDAPGRDNPLLMDHVDQQTESNVDPPLSPLDGVKNVEENKAVGVYNEKKLLVLDVNGLLVDTCSYVPYDYDFDDIIMRKAVFKRPYCNDFLKFCFEKFNVGVWTSKTKRNIEPIIDLLFGRDKHKLLFCWDQSHCIATNYYTIEKRYKPLLLKKLKKLWNKADPNLPWDNGVYNESNTIFLDDSPYKAVCNPRYTGIFPNSYRFRKIGDNSLGRDGDLRLYLDRLSMAENVQEFVKQNLFGQRAITEKNPSWRFYLKVIEENTSPPPENGDESLTLTRQTGESSTLARETNESLILTCETDDSLTLTRETEKSLA